MNARKIIEAQKTCAIHIECTDEAAQSLIPLLRELQKMGSQGSSRSIKIEDWDGNNNFDFDGDGASKIKKLMLDGEKVD